MLKQLFLLILVNIFSLSNYFILIFQTGLWTLICQRHDFDCSRVVNAAVVNFCWWKQSVVYVASIWSVPSKALAGSTGLRHMLVSVLYLTVTMIQSNTVEPSIQIEKHNSMIYKCIFG